MNSLKSFCIKNKRSILIMLLGVSLLIPALYLFYHTPDRRFQALCDEIFIRELSADGLSLHYSLKNPSDYGVRNPEWGFSAYSPEETEDEILYLQDTLAAMENISPRSLSPENRITYEILAGYLTNQLECYDYILYEEPLTFSSGMHVELPILLSEYNFYQKEDVEHYLTLLASLPEYLAGVEIFEKEKAEAGLFMSSYALEEVLNQCKTMFPEEVLAAEEHLLQVSFRKRLEALVKEEEMTAEEMDAFIKNNNTCLKNRILPAYAKLTRTLETLRPCAGTAAGLGVSKEGKAYYELLLAMQTGTDKSVPEIMEALQQSFLADYQALLACPTRYPEDFGLCEPEEIMKDLKEKTLLTFPAPEHGGDILYEVLPVEKALEDYVSPAFYLIPPLDGYEDNVIYINGASEPDPLSLYTTLAHEGYPGHLFQTTYFYEELSNGTFHPIRGILSFKGYTEGYATYAECLSYDYAKMFADSGYCDASCINRRLHLALYSMLDVCIHYYGYDLNDTRECLASFGIEDRDATEEIYEYIVNTPGNYLSYYLGYLEILECKELAAQKWGTDYSDMDFHRFFLNIGPADFSTIKKYIREKASLS